MDECGTGARAPGVKGEKWVIHPLLPVLLTVGVLGDENSDENRLASHLMYFRGLGIFFSRFFGICDGMRRETGGNELSRPPRDGADVTRGPGHRQLPRHPFDP